MHVERSSSMHKTNPVRRILIAMGVILSIGGLAWLSVSLIHNNVIRNRLNRVKDDFKAIQAACNAYGLDNCGLNFPADTHLRRLDDPSVPLTFEWSRVAYEKRYPHDSSSRSSRSGPCFLTTPVPYMERMPIDPFGEGEPYGYCGLPGDGLLFLAVVRGVGPDGKADLDLPQLRETLRVYFDGRPNAERTQPEERGMIRELIEPYLYDPANGTASGGDLILVLDTHLFAYGFGAPGGSSPEWINAPKPGLPYLAESGRAQTWPIEGPVPPPSYLFEKFQMPASTTSMPPAFMQILNEANVCESNPPVVAQDRLDPLRNHLGAFGEFFRDPGLLTEAQRSALAAWRDEAPAWWSAMDKPYANAEFKPDPRNPPPTANTYAIYPAIVLYGKSQLILAADEAAAGRVDHARDRIKSLQALLGHIERRPCDQIDDAYARRVHAELGRLSNTLISALSR